MTVGAAATVVARIESALADAGAILRQFQPGAVEVRYKSAHDPVTEADLQVNRALHRALVRDGEGWLSEEGPEDPARLRCERVWVVDPLDGTREFVEGVPEWCVSIAYVENGVAAAGGVLNPATGELFLGSRQTGVTRNGVPARVTGRKTLNGACILASRSEIARGEWARYRDARFTVRGVGSVAYKLAMVAAGLADATWTARPKHEWDVAGGVALVEAAGGMARRLDGSGIAFNRAQVRIENVAACTPGVYAEIVELQPGANAFGVQHAGER
jgi:myo-inositol-1(or 4)-monophosphatase